MLYPIRAHNFFSLVLVFLSAASSSPAQERGGARQIAGAPISITDSTRERDGLTGPVRRVRTELAKIIVKSGQTIEGARVLLETTAYDLRGRRVENALYPIDEGPVAGKEEYKYDDKGNVAEKILRGDSGEVLGKEVYAYEYDPVGNWTKMTTLVAVVDGEQVSFEPTEVTHRTITYFYGQDAAQTSAEGQTGTPQQPAPGAGDAARNTTDPKSTVRTAAAEVPASDAASGPTDGRLQLGRPLSLPRPVYPDIARQARLTGSVAVEVVVDGKGHVVSARAVSGHAQLRAAAVEAARQAVFSPTLVAGQPTSVVGVINYSFSYVK